MSKWVVDIKGKPGESPYEISVLRDDNAHGKRSYGWDGPDKIIVSSAGGPCRYKVPDRVWRKLIRVAQETADEMNAAEAQRGDSAMSDDIRPMKLVAPSMESIRKRVADGIFVGGDYDYAYGEYLIAHRDRIALLSLVDELLSKGPKP